MNWRWIPFVVGVLLIPIGALRRDARLVHLSTPLVLLTRQFVRSERRRQRPVDDRTVAMLAEAERLRADNDRLARHLGLAPHAR